MEAYDLIINKVLNQFHGISRETKEDISQDLYMFILENELKFIVQANDFERYIFVSLKRKVISLLRSSIYKPYKIISDFELITNQMSIFPNNTDDDLKRLENDILSTIDKRFSKKDKTILLSYIYDSKTYVQLGKKYGVSADTIRRKINKMLDEIRRWWK
jgi:RNA polymerase sigma factor (sigma-70 family)